MVLVCNDPAAAGELLDGLGHYDNPASHLRLARMHGRHPVTRETLLTDAGYREAVRAVGNLG
jgi:beta-N-acetylhexosaminidase